MHYLTQLLPRNFSEAIGWTILHSLWQAMLIAILSASVLVLLRKNKAKLRYRVAGLSFCLILISALATFWWYSTAAEMNVELATANLDQERFNAKIFQKDSLSAFSPLSSGELRLGPIESIQIYVEPHISLISVLWCMGFALCLLRLLGNISQVYYLKSQRNFPADEYWVEMKDDLLHKAGLNKVVALVESSMVRTPIVVGHLKPFIMFPIGLINRLDPFEAEAIIAHEIAHIVRQDYLFNILQSLVETIFYYHPAVWWLSSTMRREREIAADELAISLTGNPINYAKALVVVQELAYFPLSPALAFAGQRKSQLFTRIQRILHHKHSKSLVMEKFISASIFLLLLVGLAFAQQNTTLKNPESTSENQSSALFTAADSTSGIWEAEMENGKLCLSMTRNSKHNHWSSRDCYALTDFTPLPKGKGSFSMIREAGTITFNGEFEGKTGYGRFSFKENPDFRKMLSAQGIKNLDETLLIHFCLHNVNRDYLDFLKQKGYNDIDGDELAGLVIHGLDKPTINTYLNIFAKAGKKDVRLEELMSLKIHDVSEEYIAKMSSLGFKNLSLDDILSAKIHDISPEFVQSCKDMGYANLDFDQVMSFKIHGLSPEYLNSLKGAGLNNLSTDDALSFKIHDVTPAYVQELKSAGLTTLSAEDVMNFKIHGMTPELIASYRNYGFKQVDNDDLLSLKIHGVDAAFIDSYKTLFDKKLDLDEVLSLKIHDVTPAFIQNAREKGFTNMDVQEYIQLKIQFGNKLGSSPK